jgi:hypothetical protein
MPEAHFSQSETNVTLWHCIECHKLTKSLVIIHKSFTKATIGGVPLKDVFILIVIWPSQKKVSYCLKYEIILEDGRKIF